MIKTCYQPQFDAKKKMWLIKAVSVINGKDRIMMLYFDTIEAAIAFRIYIITSQHPGGLLAHDKQFQPKVK